NHRALWRTGLLCTTPTVVTRRRPWWRLSVMLTCSIGGETQDQSTTQKQDSQQSFHCGGDVMSFVPPGIPCTTIFPNAPLLSVVEGVKAPLVWISFDPPGSP